MEMAQAKARLEEWYDGKVVDISPEVLDCAYKAICFYLENEIENQINCYSNIVK